MEYEVRCHHCDTTFPPGTKRCVHCGGRIEKSRRTADLPEGVRISTADTSDDPTHGTGPVGSYDAAGYEEEEAPRFSLLRILMNSFWVLFIVVAMIARACSEN